MDDLVLNFSTFYCNAVKQHSNWSQFDSVSILLLGKKREDCLGEVIDNATSSCYVSGRRPIRNSILTNLLNISDEEAMRRVNMLGIQDIHRVVDTLKALICKATNLSKSTKEVLLESATTAGSEYAFVAKVFLVAVKYRAKSVTRHIGKEMQYPPPEKQLELPGVSRDCADEESGPISASVDKVRSHKKNTSKQEPFSYSHEAIEVSVSYRPLSMPKDKNAVENYFLCHCEGAFTHPDYAEVEDILSGTDSDKYFLAEIRGTYKGISFELSRWKELPFCTGLVLQFEAPVTLMGSADRDEIMTDISNIVQKGASVLCGTKFLDITCSNQILVHGIFRIRMPPVNSNSIIDEIASHPKTETQNVKKQADCFSDDTGETEEIAPYELEEDAHFDDILKIFKRR